MGLFDGFFGNNVPLSAGYRRHERAADRAASEGRGADARRERRRMLDQREKDVRAFERKHGHR